MDTLDAGLAGLLGLGLVGAVDAGVDTGGRKEPLISPIPRKKSSVGRHQ